MRTMTSLRFTVLAGILCLLTHRSYGANTTVPASPLPTAGVLTITPSQPIITTTPTMSSSSPSMSSSSPSMSSSSPSISMSPSPTPIRPASNSEFLFINGTNGTVCAHVTAKVELTIKYKNETNKNKTVERSLSVTDMFPAVDTNLSVCGNKTVVMTIAFFSNRAHIHYLKFNFTNTSKDYELSSIDTILDVTDTVQFPAFNSTYKNVTGKTDRIFSTSFKKYYKCSSNHSYDMDVMLMPPSNATVNATVTSLSVKVYDFKAQAFDFNNKTTGDYGKSSKCSQDQKSSKIVPIAVGAALAGLVIVVLIAYLIGRFRSRKQNSYEALS